MSPQEHVDRSALRLSEVARHVIIPEGIVDSLWYEVSERCQEFGESFDAWQDGLGEVALGLREDGQFAATIGGITLSIPRQVAKTFIVMRIVVALCSLFPGLTVIWTAHRMRTATNTFQKMKAFVLRPAVRPHLKAGGNNGTAIRDANGEQEIPFANGSRILFGAREAGFGRGFDEVDIEVFDEAQILTIKALEDMVAATNQSRFEHGALLFYMGTPPRPTDPGEVFAERRAEALAAKKVERGADFKSPVQSGDAVYVECSGDPSGNPDDPRQVEIANPSYPHRTPPVAVKRLRKNLPDKDSWRREGLGIWDEVTTASSLISESTWSDLSVEDPPADGVPSYGVRFSVDGSRVALAVALHNGEEPVHVEVVRHKTMADGIGWLVAWLEARWRTAGAIVVDGKSDAGALVAALRERRVPARKIVTPSVEQVIAASAMFHEAVKAGGLTHFAQEGLDAAVTHATKRPIGKAGGWGWQGTTDDIDVLPLEAATLAHFGAVTTKRTSANSGGGRRVVVLS